MPKGLGAGDRLASGAVRATFLPGETVSKRTWAEAFDDFDPEAFKNGTPVKEPGLKETTRRRPR
jgi:hypothetical protein